MKKSLLLLVFLVCAFPLGASAYTFKYDTKYALSGSFYWGPFGKVNVSSDSFLYYDSATDILTIEAGLISTQNNNKNADLDVRFRLGSASPSKTSEVNGTVDVSKSGSKVVFNYADGSNKKNGLTQIGIFDVGPNAFIGNRPVTQGDYMMFSTGMKPFIYQDKHGLIFQSWLAIWGKNPSWDVHADPKFRLTEIPGVITPPPTTPVPEPFTLGLFGSGLLAAGIRRRSQKTKA